ncbi:adhesion G-protein coupled receptor G5 [Ictalurus punctatus]|uniref:Adhesion G-protein coupled receptor G5 n=1 Tax=Ictalurus punctatus TaxID=7998 RepID=A0A2D0RUE6_ICTPU|nr:adhesion G-protein coupled receptor G5 [Ictalurus punctatus]XP_017333797.1 adhesion G-protein coupled receptor G5 [Ictalurus punctatus]
MSLLYFMVLLIFGIMADDDQCPMTTNGNFLYNNGELNITEDLTSVLCTWDGIGCYVECTFFNLTTNITAVINKTSVVEYLDDQIKILSFKISEHDITCNVTKCRSKDISELIIQSSNSNDLNDLKRPTRIKKFCSELIASDGYVKNVYIRAEKIYIDALISLVFNGTTKNYDLEEFNMTVVQIDMMNTTDHGLVQISAPKVPGDNLTLDVFIPPEPFVSVSGKPCKVCIVTYPSVQLFINNSYPVLKSKVIRVETVGQEMEYLSKRLVINFTLNSREIIPENYTLSCQFYDVDAVPEQKWDDMGSFTNLENFNSSNTVTCSYNHMTPFAVLLVDMNVLKIDPQQWKILSYMSYIGCSFSSFFSIVTIFLYVFMKSPNRSNSIRIHVSLSVALFFLNTSFLLIEWGATWSQDTVCVIIAVIIQYSLLSCFSWMAIEAIHLYLLLIKVFNTYVKHYMVKLSLFGWGMPAVIVGGSLCVYGSKPFYGTTQIHLSSTNETTQFCWITDPYLLYGMNIPYFSLTILFNTSILVAVTNQIFKMRCLNVQGSKLLSRKDICTVLGLTVLLGMTWGLALFTSGYTNYPILYLFCICNTLQGLFVFLWFYGTMKKDRDFKTQTSTLSEPASTKVKTYESSFTH